MMARFVLNKRDADLISGKVHALLMRGALREATAVLRSFLKEKRERRSPFRGIRQLSDVPLALGSYDGELIDLLDQENIRTIGQLQKFTDQQLLTIQGMGPARLNRLHQLVERLTKAYVAYRIDPQATHDLP